MTYWLITDTHFGHKKMIAFCGRPQGFEDKILSNLKQCLNPKDVLIHLGDVCIGNDAVWNDNIVNASLGATRILLKGNHDKKSNSWYLDHGWHFVAERIFDTYFGNKILLSHYPIEDIGYDINIHGHFHNSDHRRHEPELVAIKNSKQKLLAIEHTNLMPVKLENILSPKS
jgi:calcineurin-like phosphoesterase family protein